MKMETVPKMAMLNFELWPISWLTLDLLLPKLMFSPGRCLAVCEVW